MPSKFAGPAVNSSASLPSPPAPPSPSPNPKASPPAASLASPDRQAGQDRIVSGTSIRSVVSDPCVKTPKTRYVIWLLSLILVAVCMISWIFVYDRDESNVFRAAVEQVHGSDGVNYYVLRANTGPCTLFGMSAFH